MGHRQMITIKVTTTGGAGVATGSGIAAIPGGFGRLRGLALAYAGTAPATTDVVVTCVLGGHTKTLMTRNNTVTPLPLSQVQLPGVDGVGVATAVLVEPEIFGYLKLDVAQCNALTDAVVLTAIVEGE